MIKEAYCSFEVCKLLKEKGFDEECKVYYRFPYTNPIQSEDKSSYNNTFLNEASDYEKKLSDIDFSPYDMSNSVGNEGKEMYICPTQQMTMKWLREVHGLHVDIAIDDLDWSFQIFDIKNRDENLDPKYLSESYTCHKTYEEAVNEGLKYCLENLL